MLESKFNSYQMLQLLLNSKADYRTTTIKGISEMQSKAVGMILSQIINEEYFFFVKLNGIQFTKETTKDGSPEVWTCLGYDTTRMTKKDKGLFFHRSIDYQVEQSVDGQMEDIINLYGVRLTLIAGLVITYMFEGTEVSARLKNANYSYYQVTNDDMVRFFGEEHSGTLYTLYDDFKRLVYDLWFNLPFDLTGNDKRIKLNSLEAIPYYTDEAESFFCETKPKVK